MGDSDPQKKRPVKLEDLTCERCGGYGAMRLGDYILCAECFTNSGSCCPEFGQDDLWTAHERGEAARKDK